MKTNLLLLDSYLNIDNLISYSFSFCNRTNRKLKIVYVFDFNWVYQNYLSGSEFVSPNLLSFESKARKNYDIAKQNIKEKVEVYLHNHDSSIPFNLEITETNRFEVIKTEFAKDPDLLLLISNLQSYTDSGIKLIGSSSIAEEVNCPVVVIPQKANNAQLNDVVYVSNYNPEDINSLKHLSGVLNTYTKNTHLSILHNDKNFDFVEKLKWSGFKSIIQDEINLENIDFSFKLKKDLLNGIRDYSKNNDYDLLVLLHEKRGFFEQIFSTDKTKNVLMHIDKPVLVYHEK